MAVNLLVALVIFTVPVISLNLDPLEFLGPYTDDPTRWPYGGCVEVSKVYPAPGSHLPPPAERYARYWSFTVTVVFSRPVTRILWNNGSRTWLRNPLNLDREVQSCAKQACLVFVQNGVRIHLTAATAGPSERGQVFSDEYQFTFTVPTYIKDHVSEVLFVFDGGWMYSPVYKFITNPHVEYVPYVAVRYLPPQSFASWASSRPPERDVSYWVNYPTTCTARGGLIHRPSIFSRTKRKQQISTANSPKLLTELTEIMKVSGEGKHKLRLYFQMKQPGVYNVELPVSIKLLDNGTQRNISFALPAVKLLVINFTSPHLYIPVTTKYMFDYRERGYYEAPRWIAYLHTWKALCHSNATFDCNMFNYTGRLPNPLLHGHHVTFQSHSDGYKLAGTSRYGMGLILYHQFAHQLAFPEDKQLYFEIPQSLRYRYDFYSEFENCLYYRDETINCYTSWWDPSVGRIVPRELTHLVLDPYWKLTSISDKYSGEVIDHFMISNELPKTIYGSVGIEKVPDEISGMMRYSATGSLYEKDMARVIPLRKFNDKFSYQPKRKLRAKCQSGFKRVAGKWGKLTTFIEHGNIYRLHVPESSSTWSVQQTLNVRYNKRNGEHLPGILSIFWQINFIGRQDTLNATIISFPEHVKEAVERYAVLTNVQPNVYTDAQQDTRLRSARESYPLDKAVFVPQDLVNKHGCGTLNITEDDIKQIDNSNEFEGLFCDKPPDDCTGLPYDSLDRFPLIPPFNVLDLIGPVDHTDASKVHHRRALYYHDDTVDDLFILNSPNSHYTTVVEINGAEVKDPEFVEKSCSDFWKFSPDRHEITKGHLIATITNTGEGGSDVVLTVQCTPKLGVFPAQATVWVDPHQTKPIKFVLFVYPKETEDSFVVYKCKLSTTIDVTPFSSTAGKTFPTCDLFIPTFRGYFTDPCEAADHDITYYHLPKEFADSFSLNVAFLFTLDGREYKLIELISVKLVKYHTIRLSCENDNVITLTEDQLVSSSMNNSFVVVRDVNLTYTIDKLLQERVYIFRRKHSPENVRIGCSLTLTTPFASCGVLARRYIIITEPDMLAAKAIQESTSKVTAKRLTKTGNPGWHKLISEREEVLSAILVCTIMSLVLIALIVAGKSTLFFLYDKKNDTEKKMKQIKAEIGLAKQEHEEAWNNPRMYLKSGMLGPYYVLQGFKATDALDTADLKMLKLSGVLRYRDKELKVVVEYIDTITVKRSYGGKTPDEVWLKASTGMYLLKKNHVSEEYKEEFNSVLQRCMERNRREY